MQQLQRKYGFWTATAMVVGIVIGSGVFFKADDVLKAAGGSLPIAMLAWGIGGAIMIITAYVFANIGARIERINGVVDYFEAAYGEKGGYLVAWFMTFIYYPTLVAVLAWVSANYSISLLGLEKGLWPLAYGYLIFFFLLNLLSPVLAGMWQVSATVIKLVPLVLVAIVGGISGVLSGQTLESFTHSAEAVSGGGLAVATLATAFAYEGWIIATSINAEIKDAKRNLPRALLVGTVIVAAVYMLYYLGISGVLSNAQVLAAGDNAPVEVISLIFGRVAGTALTVFVVISCLGTLNGLIMGSSRGMFSIALRDLGPKAEFFKQVNIQTNSTLYSGILGMVLSCFWLMVWYGNFAGWWGGFMDISELPIAFLYLIYIAIYIWVMRTFTDLGMFGRFIAPLLAGCGSMYIIWGAVQKDMFLSFFILALVIGGAGYRLMNASR
ncbi:MAG: amino acid permease [Desulfopila sp.]|jgi:APA family basic amino acid/polyamine antiporter|nr:amino acid permease [Desulfopila sp.]